MPTIEGKPELRTSYVLVLVCCHFRRLVFLVVLPYVINVDFRYKYRYNSKKMRILQNKIKKWSFKQRLYEIQSRLTVVQEPGDKRSPIEEVDECLQILNYWMTHMAGEVEIPKKKKKKKPVNLW